MTPYMVYCFLLIYTYGIVLTYSFLLQITLFHSFSLFFTPKEKSMSPKLTQTNIRLTHNVVFDQWIVFKDG